MDDEKRLSVLTAFATETYRRQMETYNRLATVWQERLKLLLQTAGTLHGAGIVVLLAFIGTASDESRIAIINLLSSSLTSFCIGLSAVLLYIGVVFLEDQHRVNRFAADMSAKNTYLDNVIEAARVNNEGAFKTLIDSKEPPVAREIGTPTAALIGRLFFGYLAVLLFPLGVLLGLLNVLT